MPLCLEFQIVNGDKIKVLKTLIQQSAKLGKRVGHQTFSVIAKRLIFNTRALSDIDSLVNSKRLG